MPLTEEEIDKEKAAKPRPDLVPPRAIMAAGRALGYGANKHGLGRSAWGTYRDAGTEQGDIRTHVASFERHWQRFKQGLRDGVHAVDPESGIAELDCAAAQLAIVVDQYEDPPLLATIAEPDPWALPDGWAWFRDRDGTHAARHEQFDDVLWSRIARHCYYEKGTPEVVIALVGCRNEEENK